MKLPWKHRLELKGSMPERALLRFKRANIAVYDVKKKGNDKLLFSVADKDLSRALALYPKQGTSLHDYRPYTLRQKGVRGLWRDVWSTVGRVGLWLGALLFCALTLYADSYVFTIEFVGSTAYVREAKIALAEAGIKPFSRYKKSAEDLVCAKLLSLSGVEFCSVQKSGGRVRVEMRTNDLARQTLQQGSMRAKHGGIVVKTAVLRGTPLKKVGDSVAVGEALAGDWFTTQSGEQVRVEIIARVQIACTYQAVFKVDDEKTALANAYLEVGVTDVEFTQKQVENTADGYRVSLAYTVVERWNF